MASDRTPGGSPAAALPVPDREFVGSLFDWLEPNYNGALLTYSLAQDLRWKWELLHRLRPTPGQSALDLACGTGLIYDRLVRRLGFPAVVGLDINRAMLARARQARPGARVLRGDAARLPFRDRTFDLVTAGYLFKYAALAELAREVRRVLKPGGKFGGYDFSAPLRDRPSGRIYSLYLRTILPWMGQHHPGRAGRWPELFGFLADVATGSGWESRVEGVLRDVGFRTVDRVASLGGAITWVWAEV